MFRCVSVHGGKWRKRGAGGGGGGSAPQPSLCGSVAASEQPRATQSDTGAAGPRVSGSAGQAGGRAVVGVAAILLLCTCSPDMMRMAQDMMSKMSPEQVRSFHCAHASCQQGRAHANLMLSPTPTSGTSGCLRLQKAQMQQQAANMTPDQMKAAMNMASGLTPDQMQAAQQAASSMTPEQVGWWTRQRLAERASSRHGQPEPCCQNTRGAAASSTATAAAA